MQVTLPEHLTSITVRQEGECVLLLDEHGRALARMPWDKAEALGRAIIARAADAEAVHWGVIDKHFTDGLRVRRVLGIPVITSKDDMERLGNGLKRIGR